MFPKFFGPHGPRLYTNKGAKYLVLDFEASTTEQGPANPEAYLVLACWSIVDTSTGEVTKHYKFGDQYQQQELLRAIRTVDFVVAHNAKYELKWLKRCGLELRDVLIYCTMLGQWVLDGNERLPRSLRALAIKYGIGVKPDLIAHLWGAGLETTDIPPRWLQSYCENDVELTYQIFLKQSRLLEDRNQLHLAYVRNLTATVLADIEYNGMNLDQERVQAEYQRVTTELSRLQDELEELTGGVNLNSTKQLGVYLYETLAFPRPKDHRGREVLTASGKLPTDSATLAKLEATTEEQRRFVELYRKFNKLASLLSKNLEFFRGVCEERNGNFTAVFNQNVTKTHRLSSSGVPLIFREQKKARSVQFQNLPREYKNLFCSGDDEYEIGEADGAQLEFRVAADLGRDSVAYEAIANEEDVHSDTAKVFVDWNVSKPRQPHPDFIGKDYVSGRQPAKPQTFKPLYGGRGNHPAEQEYCKFFNEKYNQIHATQRGWTLEVLATKELRTPYGMIFRWPGVTVNKKSGYISNTTEIFNFPIQGLATGEIVPIALIHFWYLIKDRKISILNTVHDSIVSKVHKEEREWYVEASRKCFTEYVFKFLKEVYNYDFVTPLGCGIKLARNWGDTKEEVKFNVKLDGSYTRK